MMVGSTATLVGISKEMALGTRPSCSTAPKSRRAAGRTDRRRSGQVAGQGLVGLVYWENGFRNLTNSKRPINRMEDLNGIKLRVMQNNVFLDSFKTLGTNAVPMAFSNCSARSRPAPSTARKTRTTPSCRASSTRCRST